MKKFLTSIVSAITLTAFCLNDLQLFPVHYNANAESYRTSYTIFGDLNNDKSIDSFDVILMRSKVMETEYDKLYDFNCDDKVDSDDLTLLSDYVLGKNCIFDAYLCDDADEDYVCDLIEVAYLKSNPDSKDSDGDTLTDFEEVVYTNTSPIDKYTRKLSVTDADDDADEDKLTNKEELALQTSPLLTDSDEDGIDDYEEINKYNTNPNDDDSDADHIIDGDEIKLGLKPDSDKSNGSTYDYERIFDNKIPASSELLSYINAEGSPYEVSIDIKSAGNVNKALTVHTGDYSNTSEDNHIIGKSVLFSYDEKLSVDSAKIYFKPNDIDGSIENYMLFQFFPETNYLLPVETKYTKDSAYVETNELGTFCLIDVKDILDSKENTSKVTSNGVQILAADIKVSLDDIVWDYTLDETEVLFYIDISNCATDTVESTKQSILDFSEALFEHCDNAAIQIIGYDFLSNVSGAKIQEYSDSNGSEILINLTSVVEAIEKIEADKQVAENDLDMAIYYLNNNIIRNGLFSSECKNRYVFITSDSSLSLTQNHTGYYYNGVPDDTKGILEEMSNEGIHVNTLFSDNLLNNSRAVKGIKYYKDACDEYDFGVYTKSSTGYFGNTGYARVYSDAITDIQSLSVMYTCSVSPNAIPSSVERNAFINSLPPSYDKSKVPAADSDGNVNFKDAAVKVGAASLDKNGNLVFKNLYNACDESDLTRKGYEQLTENMGTSKKLVWDSFQITPFSDKILYNDDDGDGIPNKYDPLPDKPHHPGFAFVESPLHIPKLGDISYTRSTEYVKAHENELYENLYKNRFPEYWGKPEATARYVAYLNALYWSTRYLGNEANTILQLIDYYNEYHNYNIPGSTPPVIHHDICTAAGLLYHYHTCYGGTYEFDATEIVEESDSGSSCFHEIIYYLKTACETMMIEGRECIISTTDTAGFEAWKGLDTDENSVLSNHSLDIFLALNKCRGSVVAKCTFDGKTYNAEVKYYVQDYYDFYEFNPDDGKLRIGLVTNDQYVLLAYFNKAKPFDVLGYYTTNISWEKGADREGIRYEK